MGNRARWQKMKQDEAARRRKKRELAHAKNQRRMERREQKLADKAAARLAGRSGLFAYNKTSAPLVLGTGHIIPGSSTNVAVNLSAAEHVRLQAQVAAGTVEFEWTDEEAKPYGVGAAGPGASSPSVGGSESGWSVARPPTRCGCCATTSFTWGSLCL